MKQFFFILFFNSYVVIVCTLMSGSLADLSRESVGKLLRRPMKNSSVGIKKLDNNLHERDSTATVGPITLTFLFICFYFIFIFQINV